MREEGKIVVSNGIRKLCRELKVGREKSIWKRETRLVWRGK